MANAPASTFERTRIIVCEVLERAPDGVPGSAALRDLGATSLDVLEILDHLEVAFDVRLDTRELSQIATLDDLAAWVDRVSPSASSARAPAE